MIFARRVFLIAGIYGLIVCLPQFFLEAKTSRQSPPAITHPEYFYGFAGLATAWQVAFLVIAQDPVRYRPMMIPSMMEKGSFAGAVAVLYAQQRIPGLMVLAGSLDLALGILFFIAYRRLAGEAATG